MSQMRSKKDPLLDNSVIDKTTLRKRKKLPGTRIINGYDFDIDVCNAPFVVIKHGKTKLNVDPGSCILGEPILRELYLKGYRAILTNRFDLSMRQVTNTQAYNLCYQALLEQVIPDIRLVLADSEGKVLMDSSAGSANTYDDYLDGLIGPNLNTNIAVQQAQSQVAGVGYQIIFSNIDNLYYYCVAIRLGPIFNNSGTLLLTKSTPITTQVPTEYSGGIAEVAEIAKIMAQGTDPETVRSIAVKILTNSS